MFVCIGWQKLSWKKRKKEKRVKKRIEKCEKKQHNLVYSQCVFGKAKYVYLCVCIETRLEHKFMLRRTRIFRTYILFSNQNFHLALMFFSFQRCSVLLLLTK